MLSSYAVYQAINLSYSTFEDDDDNKFNNNDDDNVDDVQTDLDMSSIHRRSRVTS